MKIIVSKSAIDGAVKNLSKVINKRNALPILGDILCEVKDQKMVMTGSDSEVIIITSIPLDMQDGEGKFCVGAKHLKDALSQLQEQPVTISVNTDSDMRLTIHHQTGEIFFPADSPDEYPQLATLKYNETLEDFNGECLRDALKRSLWAVSNNDMRPIMTGVNFALKDGCLDIVASDGHVLVKSSYPLINKTSRHRIGSFLMPKKAANIIKDLIDTDKVKIEWNDRYAHIRLSQYDITFRLIDGKYPSYDKIIPTEQPLLAKVSRAHIMSSLRKVMPFTHDSCGIMMIRMSFDNDKIRLDSDDYELSTGASDTLTVEYQFQPITIGMNGSRLSSAIKHLDGDDISINMTDQRSAIVLRPSEHHDDFNVLTLVMPVLLDE